MRFSQNHDSGHTARQFRKLAAISVRNGKIM